MPKYTVELCLFGGTGATIDVWAPDETHAERQAVELAERRFEKGDYDDWVLNEVTVSTTTLVPGQGGIDQGLLDKSKWTGPDSDSSSETPNTQRALELLDDLVRQIDDVHNPIPYDLHERVQQIRNAIKGDT